MQKSYLSAGETDALFNRGIGLRTRSRSLPQNEDSDSDSTPLIAKQRKVKEKGSKGQGPSPQTSFVSNGSHICKPGADRDASMEAQGPEDL